MEQIKEAAIEWEGVVYTGKRHNLILHDSSRPLGFLKSGKQGFITTEGRFVDRKEGAKIALESGQIKELNWPPDLYSEDLY